MLFRSRQVLRGVVIGDGWRSIKHLPSSLLLGRLGIQPRIDLMYTPAFGATKLCTAVEREGPGEGRVELRARFVDPAINRGAAQTRDADDVLQAARRIGSKFGAIGGVHKKPFSIN